MQPMESHKQQQQASLSCMLAPNIDSTQFSHLFIQFSLSSSSVAPSHYHLSVNQVNEFIAFQLQSLVNNQPNHPLALILGNRITLANFFNYTGFVYHYHARTEAYKQQQTTSTAAATPEPDEAQLIDTFVSAVRHELSVIESTAAAREEFEHLLAEEKEFELVHAEDLEATQRIGMGDISFHSSSDTRLASIMIYLKH